MLWNLSLIIMLPLVELLTATFAKKSPVLHNLTLVAVISASLVLSILLPISGTIYLVDFGFIKLKFMCDIYSYFFGILVNIAWLLTILYSHAYTKLRIVRNKISNFYQYLALTIFLITGSLINIFYIYPIVKAAFFTKNPEPIVVKKIPLSMKLAIISGVIITTFMIIYVSNLINFFKIYDV